MLLTSLALCAAMAAEPAPQYIWTFRESAYEDTVYVAEANPMDLVLSHVFGIVTDGKGGVRVSPAEAGAMREVHILAEHPAGFVEAHYVPAQGYRVRLPKNLTQAAEVSEGVTVEENAYAGAELSADAKAKLEQAGWAKQVGEALGVWVDVQHQMFYLIRDGKVVWNTPCGTASAGVGQQAGTNQTPLGWHKVSEKMGSGEPWGRVFRSRAASKETWKPGMDVKEDLVLTRLLWLEGLQEGYNKGRDASGALVDSKQRYIYIHGTNGEELIGQPSSHGCIRLRNDDVILAYEMIDEGTPVLITE